MKHFYEVTSLPTFDLLSDVDKLLELDDRKQIGITTISTSPNDTDVACGSLNYDWENAYWEKDEHGFDKKIVPLRDPPLREEDFNTLVSQFVGTKFEIIYQEIQKRFKVGRIRLMRNLPVTCLTWHEDSQIRLHYPIKTQKGCFMVIDDEVKHLEQNKWYLTNTRLPHTAFNGSKEERIHLVVNIMEDYNELCAKGNL